MYNPPLTEEMKQKIRDEVKKGTSRYKVAEMFGVSPPTVYRLTNNLPKCKKNVITEELKRKIRKEVMSGTSRVEIANKMDISAPTVCKFTKDLPDYRGNPGIRGIGLNALNLLLRKGYCIPTNSNHINIGTYRRLKKHGLPVKVARIGNRSVFFLEGREKEAMNALINKLGKSSMSYFHFKQITRLFGLSLSKKEKDEMLSGRFRMEKFTSKFKILKPIRKVLRQASLSDFIGRFLHSELLNLGISL